MSTPFRREPLTANRTGEEQEHRSRISSYSEGGARQCCDGAAAQVDAGEGSGSAGSCFEDRGPSEERRRSAGQKVKLFKL